MLDPTALNSNITAPVWIVEGARNAEALASASGDRIPILTINTLEDHDAVTAPGIIWSQVIESGLSKRRPVIVYPEQSPDAAPGCYTLDQKVCLFELREAMHGAQVRVCNIGKLTNNNGKAFAVADHLAAGGSLESVAVAVEPVVEPTMFEFAMYKFHTQFVVVGIAPPVVWQKDTNQLFSYNGLRELTAPDGFPTEKGGWHYYADDFVRSSDRPFARCMTLDPRLPYGHHGDVVNLWQPGPVWDEPLTFVHDIHMANIDKLFDTIFDEHAGAVKKWMAHAVRRPWERTTQGVVVATLLTGIGKSLSFEMVGKLMGSHYGEIEPERLFKNFNATQSNLVLKLVNEIEAGHIKSEGSFKKLFTNETIDIERKGKDVTPIPNLSRYAFTSNSAAALRLGRNNRRVWVCSPELDDESAEVWKVWLKTNILDHYQHGEGREFMRALFEYLTRVDLIGYDPMADVINSEAAEDMQNASRTATQIAAEELVERSLEQFKKANAKNKDEAVMAFRKSTVKHHPIVFNLFWPILKAQKFKRCTMKVSGAVDVEEYWLIGKKMDMVRHANRSSYYKGVLSGKDVEIIAAEYGQLFHLATNHLQMGRNVVGMFGRG